MTLAQITINGPEFVAISVCGMLVILLLISKTAAAIKPKRKLDPWWDASENKRKAPFCERKMREGESRHL